eukprot:SAG31_NODE_44755_length_261_cov_0.956790_1_plen_45_part_01
MFQFETHFIVRRRTPGIRPNLGLVDWNGSKNNNLIKFTGNPDPDT